MLNIFPILINWARSFQILGLLGGFSSFIAILKKLLKTNREELDQTAHFAASVLVLHCLPMSRKKDARLIWVNTYESVLMRSSHFYCI